MLVVSCPVPVIGVTQAGPGYARCGAVAAVVKVLVKAAVVGDIFDLGNFAAEVQLAVVVAGVGVDAGTEHVFRVNAAIALLKEHPCMLNHVRNVGRSALLVCAPFEAELWSVDQVTP